MRILLLAGSRCDTPIARHALTALHTLKQQVRALDYVRVARNADEALAVAEREEIDAVLVTPGAANARQIEQLAMRTGLFAAVQAYCAPAPCGQAFDIVVVSDPYQGQAHGKGERGVVAQRHELVGTNTLRYTETHIRLLAQVALDAASARSRRVTSVDQADRLETMELWRDVVAEAGGRNPDIRLEHRLVEQAIAELAVAAHRFDTIVAGGNLGGILAAQIGALTGIPSTWARALIGNSAFGIYEIASAHHGDFASAVPLDACLPAVLDALSLMFRYSGNDPQLDVFSVNARKAVLQENRPVGL